MCLCVSAVFSKHFFAFFEKKLCDRIERKVVVTYLPDYVEKKFKVPAMKKKVFSKSEFSLFQ